LANVLLDEVDRELERRGHRFAHYADDCNVYLRSRKAGREDDGTAPALLQQAAPEDQRIEECCVQPV
jgi:retron-type reverse transcriptase